MHLIIGGREIARPLLAAPDLPEMVREVLYLCWHFTSVAIFTMSACFAAAALTGNAAYTACGTTIAAGFFIIGTALVTARGISHKLAPQGWLFLPIALLGGCALLG